MTLETIAAEVDNIATHFSVMTLPELLDADLELTTFESALAEEHGALADVTRMKISRIHAALERREVVRRLHLREAEDRHWRSEQKLNRMPQQSMGESHPERMTVDMIVRQAQTSSR
jgi:MoxR-like ATPase